MIWRWSNEEEDFVVNLWTKVSVNKLQICSICTYNSVVSSGMDVGTAVKDFSRQSTMPSAQRQGCGHVDRAPHSIGAFSVRPGGGVGGSNLQVLNIWSPVSISISPPLFFVVVPCSWRCWRGSWIIQELSGIVTDEWYRRGGGVVCVLFCYLIKYLELKAL